MSRFTKSLQSCFVMVTILSMHFPLRADVGTSEPTEVFPGYDIYATTIIREGTTWKQWFAGWMLESDKPWDRMYYSVSEDSGQTWATPIEIFTIEKVQVNDPSVIKLWDPENLRYYYQMYYTYYPSGYGDATNYIAVSTSLDGINWTHLGDQDQGVLIGADNGIDTDGAWAPSVVSMDSLGNEIYLYFHNNHPSAVFRTTLSGKGLTFEKETTISVSSGFKVNVDVSIAPDDTWWMFYNGSAESSTGVGIFNTSKMYSDDGVNWKESSHNPIQDFPEMNTCTPHVVWEDSHTYQLWHGYGTSSFLDFEVYRQFFQTEDEYFLPVVASSEAIAALGAVNSIDGNVHTFWASSGYFDAIHNEWLYLDFNEQREVYQLILTPRTDENGSVCFPPDFTLQYSQNGVDWVDIPGHSYSNYVRPDKMANIFTFSAPVTAQFVKVNASRLNSDIHGNFYLQLAEIDAIHDIADVIPNTNPYLASIEVNSTDLPNFRSDVYDYDVLVSDIEQVNVMAIPVDENAETSISRDADTISIHVQSEDMNEDATYVLRLKKQITSTSVESLAQNAIRAFPNPVSDQLRISNAPNAQLLIYSSTGSVVTSEPCLDAEHIIDVSKLVPGMYVLTIQGSTSVYRQMLLKK